MKSAFATLAITVLAAVLVAPAAPALEPQSTPSVSSGQALARGNNAFAARLYGELAQSKGNLFFSPYSVSTALGMVYTGARGDTATQIRKALDFELDQARLNKAFKKMNQDLASFARKDNFKLNIADGLALTGGKVNKEFEAALEEDYDARIFSGGAGRINAWVRRKTEGRIDRIIDRLNPDSACVILNAIYFKGLWMWPFSKKRTRNEPFNVSSTRRVTAPMMYRRDKLKVLDGKDFQAVSIPYAGGELSMAVFLPRKPDGLSGLEKRLNAEKLSGWLEKLDGGPVREIDLYLPRFTMRTSYDLKPSFVKMGMTKPFEQGADFSGIKTPAGALRIGRINHKGFLDVNEKGTEAAAATAIEMPALAMRRYPVFRADHPFLFLIRDNRNSLILFMGRQADPTSK